MLHECVPNRDLLVSLDLQPAERVIIGALSIFHDDILPWWEITPTLLEHLDIKRLSAILTSSLMQYPG